MATQAAAALHLFMNKRRFAELLDEEVIERRERDGYELDDVREQYIRHIRKVAAGREVREGLDPPQELARKNAALADQTEMKNALQRGEMMTAASYHLLMTASFARVRSKLLALPSKMAPLMVETKEAADAQGKLQEVIYDALDELAATRVAGVSEDGGIIEDRS